jgi:hypothetical protein
MAQFDDGAATHNPHRVRRNPMTKLFRTLIAIALISSAAAPTLNLMWRPLNHQGLADQAM